MAAAHDQPRLMVEEGIYMLGDPIHQIEGCSFYSSAELEPLEDNGKSENFVVEVGSDVLVANEEFDHDFLCRVTEIFCDSTDKISARFKGRWFYRIEDTILTVTKQRQEGTEIVEVPIDEDIKRKGGLDERRVWLAEKDDSESYITENPLGSIVRVTKVHYVRPGMPVPAPEECEFWYNQTTDRKFYTFRDHYLEPTEMFKENPKRVLHVLDLFCGCGGLSFMDQTYEGVQIVTTHAVDMDSDAVQTYQVNNPNANVDSAMCMGVEEFLCLCKHFDRICKEFENEIDPETLSPSKRRRCEFEGKEEITSIKLKHSVKIVKNGQGEGQLAEELTDESTKIVFQFRSEDGVVSQISESAAKERKSALQRFLKECRLPRPGDIQVIVGGPPCQGVSGLNRHAKRSDLLSCHRNRLVKSYFKTIDFFKPDFTLMENVQDIMKKEDGAYVKYAVTQLLALGYQSRLGLLAAGSYGAAQYRWRCFLWGAKSGRVQLPSFPQPMFDGVITSPLANNAKCCEVKFLSEKDREEAFPMVLNEDILTDLSPVSNFCFTNNSVYKCDPRRPIQMWLRRKPESNKLSLTERANLADIRMAPSVKLVKDLIETKKKAARHEDSIPVCVADLVLCQLGANRKNDFASEVKEVYLRWVRSQPNAEELLERIKEREREMKREHGQELLDALDQLGKISNADPNLVRDHRPRMCNSDDYFRITQVPREPGKNFRDMPGVVTNTSHGTCCAGHTHAFHGSGCEGGGTAPMPKRSIKKESRIDHSDKGGWRGFQLDGCKSRTFFTPTMNLVCPRWCITYKNGLSNGRHGCFGRIRLDRVQPTVVTRAEPHNLEICHPYQDRVLSVREMARCQGFPDYYVFVATEKKDSKKKSLTRLRSQENRYKQIGNAVAPPVARALGGPLCMAAAGLLDTSMPVVRFRDEELNAVMKKAKEDGLVFYKAEIGDETMKQAVEELSVREREGLDGDEDDGGLEILLIPDVSSHLLSEEGSSLGLGREVEVSSPQRDLPGLSS